MTTLIVLSSIFLYILIGAVVGQIWNRVGERNCGSYTHDAFCDHAFFAVLAGIFWPVFPPGALFIFGGMKLATGITNLILGGRD